MNYILQHFSLNEFLFKMVKGALSPEFPLPPFVQIPKEITERFSHEDAVIALKHNKGTSTR
jgi:hypothetical protein